jgi:hypothetical protein
MSIKFSQLPSASALADANILPIVADVSGTLTSQKATLALLKSYALAGNAATATKLVTARTINGVSFDGSANITITVPLSPATTSTIGGVIVGSGLNVAVDGTLSVNTSTIATKTYVDNTSTDNAISFSVALG